LLGVERGARTHSTLPSLSRRQILAWATAHRRRTGQWPTRESGPVAEAPEETWKAVDLALRNGGRGLRGGSSLARLLARYGKKRNHLDLPRLSQKKILACADEHYRRTGQWPNVKSGPVAGVPGERWDVIDNALRGGRRGLPGGSSLARLLARKRGVRNHMALPSLSEEQILRWADLHFRRTSTWPTRGSRAIADAPGETWTGVEMALRHGKRGLPGGSSLATLLARMK
jgi:hypothetical protein